MKVLVPIFPKVTITVLSSLAVSSSLYLQYGLGYVPCVYCYVLRYMSASILILSIVGLVVREYSSAIFSLTLAFGVVGTGVSSVLIYGLLNPASSSCTVCLAAPIIFGQFLFYYALGFMLLVVGFSAMAAFGIGLPRVETGDCGQEHSF